MLETEKYLEQINLDDGGITRQIERATLAFETHDKPEFKGLDDAGCYVLIPGLQLNDKKGFKNNMMILDRFVYVMQGYWILTLTTYEYSDVLFDIFLPQLQRIYELIKSQINEAAKKGRIVTVRGIM